MGVLHTFKLHPVSEAERLWLRKASSPGFDVKSAKIDLHGQLPRGFTHERIDVRLYARNEVTPVGLWHIDPNHPLLDAMDRTIRYIKEQILAKHDVSVVTADAIAKGTGIDIETIERTFALMRDVGNFYDGGTPSLRQPDSKGISAIKLRHDSTVDDYLAYDGLDDLLESFYVRRGEALMGAVEFSNKPFVPQAPGHSSSEPSYEDDARRAVHAAIEACVATEGRAHVGNVPAAAEKLLTGNAKGRLTQAKARDLVHAAIRALSEEGAIEAWPERHREWTILEQLPRTSEPRTKSEPMTSNKKVFIVHGHDGAAKEMVARFVEKLGLEAIILHERPNKGRTIITKFREEAHGASFAVVLMTPDDEGKAKGAASSNLRARQNVVFELGFFVGKLGFERVVAMESGEVERPSDLEGVVYISLDKDDWRTDLAREFEAAGLDADWNKLVS